MKNAEHQLLLHEIVAHSGKATQHTFLDNYLGNSHPRYAINAPTLRTIAKVWMKANGKTTTVTAFSELLTSLIEGKSSTEKQMAGLLLDYAPSTLQKFDPKLFERWLSHLQGWAEVDVLCTGKYTATQVAARFTTWKKLLVRFSKSKHIETRRASLVLLCSPLSKARDEQLLAIALENSIRLQNEKEILITKAISWLLRSAERYHHKEIEQFVAAHADTLPRIVIRETMAKLKTGRKTKPKRKI